MYVAIVVIKYRLKENEVSYSDQEVTQEEYLNVRLYLSAVPDTEGNCFGQVWVRAHCELYSSLWNQNARYLAPNRPAENQHGMVGSLKHLEVQDWRVELATASSPSAAMLATQVSLFSTYLDFSTYL